MARFTMPQIFKITVDGACPTPARTELRARRHTLVVDEPPARGGGDRGPSPLETLLASYLACTNVILNIVAEERDIAVRALALSVTGDFDTRGVFGKAEVAVPFPTIALTVRIATDATAAQLEDLKRDVAWRCPVSAILRAAGSTIEEDWQVTRV